MVFNVDVKPSFSFFETESRFVDQFLAAQREGVEFNGRQVSMELSSKSADGGKFRGGNKSFGGGERKQYGGGEKRGYGERKSYQGGGEKRSYGKGERSFAGGPRKERYGK
jgi:ATP-dependent RNA helicase DeaD